MGGVRRVLRGSAVRRRRVGCILCGAVAQSRVCSVRFGVGRSAERGEGCGGVKWRGWRGVERSLSRVCRLHKIIR